MRKMIIPTLVTLLCPLFPSACVDDESVELRASREPDRRYFYGERMGSTSTTGEEPPGDTESSSGTTDDNTGDMPIGDTDGCPWWGCNGFPGESWDEIITDCTYPLGQPEIGDALCPAPKRCVTPHDFGEIVDGGPLNPQMQTAFCSIPCPAVNAMDSPTPCELLDFAMRGVPDTSPEGGFLCAVPTVEGGGSYLEGEGICAYWTNPLINWDMYWLEVVSGSNWIEVILFPAVP